MQTTTFLFLAGLLVVSSETPSLAIAQTSDPLPIEIAAAKAMLKHQYAEGAIALNSLVGEAEHAPGRTTNRRVRDQTRSSAIAVAIRGSVRNETDVNACAANTKHCRLSGVAAFLTLSEPTIVGDSASVTATIKQNSPSSRQPIDYETVLFRLTRANANGAWKVVAEQQLGIS